MPNAYIAGTGFYVPPKIVTNDELSQYMNTTDEWIRERTGIRERRYVEKGVGPSDLAIPATEQALEAAGLDVKDIDFMIFPPFNNYFPYIILKSSFSVAK